MIPIKRSEGGEKKMTRQVEIVQKAVKPAGNLSVRLAQTRREGKYLTFSLGGEEYGIGILKIKEIIGMMPITHLPQTPKFVKGVINLRGRVIPVIDLRLRFGMDSIDYAERTCIVVVEIGEDIGRLQIGIVVDSVSEVLNIKGSDIEDTPEFGTRLRTDYILGMAKMEGRVKILLDIDQVLTTEASNGSALNEDFSSASLHANLSHEITNTGSVEPRGTEIASLDQQERAMQVEETHTTNAKKAEHRRETT
jgi:purine-binding chemotaxis protein CheW